MQRQNTWDHLPSEATLWHVFSTRQISAAEAEKDCIKGKKGTQTVQNRPEFVQTAVQVQKEKKTLPTVLNQKLPTSGPGLASQQAGCCVLAESWAPSDWPSTDRCTLQCHRGGERKPLRSQSQKVLKLFKWHTCLHWVNPKSSRWQNGASLQDSISFAPSPSSLPYWLLPFLFLKIPIFPSWRKRLFSELSTSSTLPPTCKSSWTQQGREALNVKTDKSWVLPHCFPRESAGCADGRSPAHIQRCFQMPHVQSKERKLYLDVPWYLFCKYWFQLLL